MNDCCVGMHFEGCANARLNGYDSSNDDSATRITSHTGHIGVRWLNATITSVR